MTLSINKYKTISFYSNRIKFDISDLLKIHTTYFFVIQQQLNTNQHFKNYYCTILI